MVYPDNKSADEHFENLKNQFSDNLHRLRGLCDVATDSKVFVAQSFKAMEKHAGKLKASWFLSNIYKNNPGLAQVLGSKAWLLETSKAYLLKGSPV